MAKNKKIISFEQLFEEDNKIKQPQHNVLHYLTIILVYFGIMLILVTIIIKLFGEVKSFIVTYDETEMLFYNVQTDNQSLAFVNNFEFEQYESKYEIKKIYEYNDFYIITSAHNDIEDFIIDDAFFFQVFQGEIKYWDQEQLINFYVQKNSLLPDFFHIRNYHSVSEYQELSNFASALSNFVIYLFLLPPLIFLMKKDFQYDYIQVKKRKSEWFIIILVGYLYLIIGNILSDLLTTFLSDALNQPIIEAVNQQIIVQALKSEGAILMIVSAVILGPIVEEIVFRKAIFSIFKKEHFALIVSTLIFGLIHVVGEASLKSALINGLSYFIMGAAFGLIYMKNDKNIYVSIAVHMLSNLIAVIGVFFLV